MESLENFITRIKEFDELKPSELIDYFAFFLLKIKNQDSCNPIEIEACYDNLEIKRYSNVSQYLRNALRGKKPKYLKKGISYILSRHGTIDIEKKLQIHRKQKPSSEFFSMDLLKETRGYVEGIGEQVIICYDVGAYDGSLVLLRKLVETLIIELFEKNKVEKKIKNKEGNYFHLRDLIPKLIDEESWTISRNTKSALPRIKKYGDMSAHNRRFSADKKILDDIKDDVRIILEELIHLIDYPHWNKNI